MVPPKGTNDKDENGKPKLWRWTDGYKYPLPKGDNDHWQMILETLLSQDNSQCEAWKDEVQNLLIFAGLFSAVVTGFVIESYKNLTPDPNDAMIAVLSRIAAHIDNGTGIGDHLQSTLEPTTFSPAQVAVRINTLWFSSLILSLVTVVVGTVSLQWLREHQRYTKPLNHRQALAVFHLRSESLKRWHVRHVFTLLPLLLQGAVVVFFVGLMEFLASLNDIVAGVAIVLISIALLFLVGTTALPTLQLLKFKFPSVFNRSIPTQCPYKSPQAWAFRHVFIAFLSIPTFAYHIFQRGFKFWPTHLELEPIASRLRNISIWTRAKIPTIFSISSVYLPLDLGAEYSRQHWIDFDIFWLFVREKHCLLNHGHSMAHDTDPTYDLVQALSFLAQDHSGKEEFAFATFYAYKELLDTLINDRNKALYDMDQDDKRVGSKLECRLEILQSPFSPLCSAYFKQDSASLRSVRDEMLFLFMNLPGISEYSSLPDHPAGIHKLELFTRMIVCRFFYRCNDIPSNFHINPIQHFLTVQRSYPERIWDIPEPFVVDMMNQHYMILRHIFEQATTLFLGNPQAMITITGHPQLANFFEHIAWIPIPEILEPKFSAILKIIHNGLVLSLESHSQDRAYFVFFCARLYLEKVARHHWFSDFMKSNQYKQIHTDILRVLKVMIHYELQLDKPTYVRLENLWRAELYPTKHSTQIVPGRTTTASFQFYTPIPEVLRRFLPYEQLHSSKDYLNLDPTIYPDYDSIEVQVQGLNFDICHLGGGEAITFFDPGEIASLESE